MQADAARLAAALPDYEVGEPLGHGQFGVVWAARHRGLGRDVAVKQLIGSAVDDPRHAERFRREARLLAQLDHRHVVRVYDYREAGGLSLLIMQRLTGGTFDERRTAGLSFESLLVAVVAAASGLHHLHLRGVLHRDVKPANLIFDGAGVLKVTDFGTARGQGILDAATAVADPGSLAAALQAARGEQIRVVDIDPDALQLSFAGEFMGTPGFAAPEQAATALRLPAAEVGPAADQYALAAVLYQALTGCYTHAVDGGALVLLSRRATFAARPAQEANPAVPHRLSVVIMRALELRPADRYASVEDFALALAGAAAAEWGPGWARRSSVAIAEPGRLWDAMHGGAQAGAGEVGTGNGAAGSAAAVTMLPDALPSAAVPPVPRAPIPAGRVSARPTQRGRRWPVVPITAAVLVVAAAVTGAVLLWPTGGTTGSGTAGTGAAAIGSTATPATGPGAAMTGPAAALPSVAVTQSWRFPTGGNVFASPTVVGDVVVIGSFDGTVYGIDRESGAERWRAATGGPVRSSAATDGGLVFVGSNDGLLRAIQVDTGSPGWTAALGFEIASSPLVAGGRVIVGADKLYAFDAQTGAPGWNSPTGDVIVSSPAAAGDLVIVGSNDGFLYGIALADGSQVWKLDTGGPVVAAPMVADGVAYVGSRSGWLFAVTAATGSPLWQRDVGGVVNGAAAVGPDRVTVGTEAGTVVSVLRTTGEPQWTWSTTGRIDAGVTLTDTAVVAAGNSGAVTMIDPVSGEAVGGFSTGGPVLSTPRVMGGDIYVGSYDDSVYRLLVASN